MPDIAASSRSDSRRYATAAACGTSPFPSRCSSSPITRGGPSRQDGPPPRTNRTPFDRADRSRHQSPSPRSNQVGPNPRNYGSSHLRCWAELRRCPTPSHVSGCHRRCSRQCPCPGHIRRQPASARPIAKHSRPDIGGFHASHFPVRARLGLPATREPAVLMGGCQPTSPRVGGINVNITRSRAEALGLGKQRYGIHPRNSRLMSRFVCGHTRHPSTGRGHLHKRLLLRGGSGVSPRLYGQIGTPFVGDTPLNVKRRDQTSVNVSVRSQTGRYTGRSASRESYWLQPESRIGRSSRRRVFLSSNQALDRLRNQDTARNRERPPLMRRGNTILNIRNDGLLGVVGPGTTVKVRSVVTNSNRISILCRIPIPCSTRNRHSLHIPGGQGGNANHTAPFANVWQCRHGRLVTNRNPRQRPRIGC